MNTDVQNLSMKQIGQIELDSATIGTDINKRLNSIDENFKAILSSEYLKGVEGDSIVTTEVILAATKSEPPTEGEKLYQEFSKLIYGDATPPAGVFDNNEKVVLIQQKNSSTGKVTTISSLPFVFKDPNSNAASVEEYKNYNDRSCIIYYDYKEQSWQTIQTFPTFYYNEDLGDFCWKINGSETQLNVRGIPGNNGIPGSKLLLAKGKKDENDDNITNITEFYEVSMAGGSWRTVEEINEGTNLILTNNTPVLVQIEVQIEFDGDTDPTTTTLWQIGSLFIKPSDDKYPTTYISYFTGDTLAYTMNDADKFAQKEWCNDTFETKTEVKSVKTELETKITNLNTQIQTKIDSPFKVSYCNPIKDTVELSPNTITYIADFAEKLEDIETKDFNIVLPSTEDEFTWDDTKTFGICQCVVNVGPVAIPGEIKTDDPISKINLQYKYVNSNKALIIRRNGYDKTKSPLCRREIVFTGYWYQWYQLSEEPKLEWFITDSAYSAAIVDIGPGTEL
jgi:hypothetical protein